MEPGQQADRLHAGQRSEIRAYNLNRLAVVPADGGAPRVVTEKLDRSISRPVFSADGASVCVLVS